MSQVLDAVSSVVGGAVLWNRRRGQDHDVGRARRGRGRREGKRAVVVTIDPARRLADALGLDGIGNDCARVDLEGLAGRGELWVTMLDTKATFDA